MTEQHIRYGGLKFTNQVPVKEINRFVRELPANRRESLFEVAEELATRGMIKIEENSWRTVDQDQTQEQL